MGFVQVVKEPNGVGGSVRVVKEPNGVGGLVRVVKEPNRVGEKVPGNFQCRGVRATHLDYEPPHDKTNKMTVRTAKTQISLCIRPAKTLIRLGRCSGWSESSLGAHSFCWFCREAALMVGQGHANLAAGAGWIGYVLFLILVCPFLSCTSSVSRCQMSNQSISQPIRSSIIRTQYMSSWWPY